MLFGRADEEEPLGHADVIVGKPADRERIVDLVFPETTIGANSRRWHASAWSARWCRWTRRSVDPLHVARRNGRVLNAQPEFDDLVRLAGEHGRPTKVQAVAAKAWLER